MSDSQSRLVEKLGTFIQFERDARDSKSTDALAFVACNRIRSLVKYDSALFLTAGINGRQRVEYVSGVSSFDPQAPLVVFAERLVNSSDVSLQDTAVHSAVRLPQQFEQDLYDIQLDEVVTATLVAGKSTMVFVRQEPWQLPELQLIQQTAEVTGHAFSALQQNPESSVSRLLFGGWRSASRVAVVAAVLCAFIPVRQSVIAAGQITAKSPTVVTSGLNGVVRDVMVSPNEVVTKGQLLVKFDDTELRLQKNTLMEELSLAREHLRKAQQQSLSGADSNSTSRNRFSQLQSRIELKSLELAYIEDMMNRLDVRARSNGVAVFSRTQDWIGRSVVTGEKIMEIADASDQQFEIWVAANDAIDLPAGGAVKFFPDAFPLNSVKGSVESVSYFASTSDKDTLAYRVLASVAQTNSQVRLGMKGTVRLYGDRVALAYYLFRKPLSAIRKTVGL